jgi:hypothetical protein
MPKALGAVWLMFAVNHMSASEFQETHESVYDVLARIRKMPGIFIGEPSINSLQAFLNGYVSGLAGVGSVLRQDDFLHRCDFRLFNDWVARRLGYSESTLGWCRMLREKSASERDAFERFFTLLDEFRRETA